MNCIFRPLTAQDEPLLWQMLMFAAQETSLEAVKAHPALVHYVLGWGRAGDMGLAAQAGFVTEAVGAAWLRLTSADDKGFGYIDDATPELAIALQPAYHGRGIGTQMLRTLLDEARQIYPAVSLSVRGSNPAVRLYERVGFRKVEGSDVVNRVGSISFTMLCRF